MTTKFYKGFEIIAIADKVTDTDEWTVKVKIRLNTGAKTIDRQTKSPKKAYPSMEEAIKAGLLYGEQIVDSRPDQLPQES